MITRRIGGCIAFVIFIHAVSAVAEEPAHFKAELVFPLHHQHNHASSIVECPNGELLVSWYRGSGERKADDVAVYGARRRPGEEKWSEPFVMADTPEPRY